MTSEGSVSFATPVETSGNYLVANNTTYATRKRSMSLVREHRFQIRAARSRSLDAESNEDATDTF